ncbi:hypothetical protein BGZ83_004460 [Gryganskiella cystojenkinii]|nr:hypothetical protein BGZ83_004460 [Gryganskiella cystojenkinii]
MGKPSRRSAARSPICHEYQTTGRCRSGSSCQFEHGGQGASSSTLQGNQRQGQQQNRGNNSNRRQETSIEPRYEWFDGTSSNGRSSSSSSSRPHRGNRRNQQNQNGHRGRGPGGSGGGSRQNSQSGENRGKDAREPTRPSYYGVTRPKPTLDDSWKQELRPDDFRFQSVSPTKDDINADEYPEPEENIVHRAYDSTNQYIETHFRLLRADCIIPVRSAIRSYRDGAVEDNDMMMYINVRPVSLLFATMGLVHRMSFVVDGRRVNWRQSKRLVPGTMVSLSTDHFETFRFATVVERDLECLQNPRDLQIGLKFLHADSRIDFDPDVNYIMIEAMNGYYEAYQHVLNCLQNKDPYTLPFQPQLVGLEPELKQPRYSRGIREFEDRDHIETRIQEFPSVLKGGEIEHNGVQSSVVDAVHRLLTKEFAVLQGPPGTGKTFLGLLTTHMLMSLCSQSSLGPIVVVCQTNHALDQFLEGIMTFERRIVRIGSRSKSLVVSPNTLFNIRMRYKDNPQQARMDGVQPTPPFRFFRMKDKLECEMLVLLEELAQDYIPLTYLLDLEIITQSQYDSFLQDGWVMSSDQDEITTARAWLRDAPQIPNPDRVDVFDDENLQDDFDLEVGEEELQDRVDEFMASVTDEHKISGQSVNVKRTIVCNLVDDAMGDVSAYLNLSNVHDIPCEKRMGVYKVWLQKYQESISAMLGTLHKIYDIVCENIRKENRMNDLLILNKARVVGMTTTAASKYHDLLCLLKPRVMICEEASETLEAHLLAALTPSVEHFILIGDHEQLRPSMAVRDLQDKNIDVSMFERLIRNQMPFSMLDVQRRMRPEIRSLVSPIYPNLRDHRSVCNYDDVRGMVHNLWFLTHDEPDMLGNNNSHINPHEIGIAAKLAVYLLQQGYPPTEITILTMYAGQRTKINERLRQSHVQGAGEIRVSTVDGFQGEENEIIILSLVRSNINNNIGFLRTSNRVCVSLSRAKKGFYILGNAKLLMDQSKLWKTIIQSLFLGPQNKFRIGNRIQLRCPTHPETVSEIGLESEFDRVQEETKMVQNKSVVFLNYPTEFPVEGEHLEVQTKELNTDLKANDVLLRNLYISLDPYMRGRMRNTEKSYTAGFEIGKPLNGSGVSEVIESKNASFPVGSIVTGFVGFEQYSIVHGAHGLRIIPDGRNSKIPLSSHIGVLGMPGMTAYGSLLRIGKPKAGETIFISAASGAVGQLVGQIAKRLGLRVIGSAGSDDKVKYLIEELQFDAALNYKDANFEEELVKLVPNGINIYYENVGGSQLDLALANMADHGRIVACGMISQYNNPHPYGIKNLMNVVAKRLTIQGFIVSDFASEVAADFARDVGGWLVKKEIIYKEDVAVGIESTPQAFIGMLKGKNFGKQVVKIADL